MTTAQVSTGLLSTQLNALSATDIVVLTSTNLNALTSIQFSAISTTEINRLTTDQIATLSTAQVSTSLTSTQLNALSVSRLTSISTQDVAVISTTAINGLTSYQVSSFTSSQGDAFTSPQTTALGTYNFGNLSISPIVLDLTGKGIQTTSINNGVNFDLLADGKPVHTGWIAEGEGLLVLDSNNNGILDTGAELFGQGTTLANGQKAVDGYQALASLDTNSDGVINAQDAQFNELKVWVDSGNSNGNATGVLESLSQLGITQLNLNAQTSTQTNNGNIVGLISSYQTASGTTGTMADVWFAAQNTPGLASTVVTTQTGSSSATVSNNQVSGLANAISNFNQGVSTPISTNLPSVGAASTASTGLLSTNLISSITALGQFNANGQALGAGSNSVVGQVPITLSTTGVITASPTTLAIPTKKNSSS